MRKIKLLGSFVIYLGYPIWWGTAPKIINTFIESNADALKGKTIVTFCTSGGSDVTKSDEERVGITKRVQIFRNC